MGSDAERVSGKKRGEVWWKSQPMPPRFDLPASPNLNQDPTFRLQSFEGYTKMFAPIAMAQRFDVARPADARELALSQFAAVNCYTPRTCDTACRFGQFALLPNKPACGTRPQRVVHSNSIL